MNVHQFCVFCVEISTKFQKELFQNQINGSATSLCSIKINVLAGLVKG